MRPPAGASPTPAPADNRSWGDRPGGYYGDRARHGHVEWRGEGGWDVWRVRDAWDRRDWWHDWAHDYDTGSDDAGRSSRRPRSPSGRPRRPRDSGPDDTRSDGRGAARRRRLSSDATGGGGSAFACDLWLGFLGAVIDVDDGCLVRLHDSSGNPRSAMVTSDEWLRRYQLAADGGGTGFGTGVSPRVHLAIPADARRLGGASPPDPPDRSAAGGTPLLAITLPDWGDLPEPHAPVPWAKWEGGHGVVLDTDVPSGCDSDGAVTHTESCGSSCTAIARSPRGDCDTAPRPYLDPGGPAVDPSTSPVDEAWLAGGDLVDVIRATGFRDG